MAFKLSLRKWLIIGLGLLVLIPLLAYAIKNAPPFRHAPEVIAFHDTRLVAMNGDMLEEVLAESTTPHTLLFVYASWCPHCKRQFDELDTLQKWFPADRLTVIHVGVDKDAMGLSSFLVERFPEGPDFIPYHVNRSEARIDFREKLTARGLHFQGDIPYLVLFDADKNPITQRTGTTPAIELRMLISEFLEERMPEAEAIPSAPDPVAPNPAEQN